MPSSLSRIKNPSLGSSPQKEMSPPRSPQSDDVLFLFSSAERCLSDPGTKDIKSGKSKSEACLQKNKNDEEIFEMLKDKQTVSISAGTPPAKLPSVHRVKRNSSVGKKSTKKLPQRKRSRGKSNDDEEDWLPGTETKRRSSGHHELKGLEAGPVSPLLTLVQSPCFIQLDRTEVSRYLSREGMGHVVQEESVHKRRIISSVFGHKRCKVSEGERGSDEVEGDEGSDSESGGRQSTTDQHQACKGGKFLFSSKYWG
jgi:hypothetical protein